MKKDIDEYLQEGMYGARETKPDERRRFLGSLRERTVLALKKRQVLKKAGMAEVENAMKKHPSVHLLLNGNMRLAYFKEYKKLAQKHKINYTTVTNKDAKTDLGLILIMDEAVDKENIFLKETDKTEKDRHEKTLGNYLKSLFKIQ
ncbi:uncharacterized protein YueI [Salirhabdus euzebyi]|uniref:Uncharacterized protein YueI n=1 Tax=Salirhabdus euzebyi TaxID=394506 RepID=A0A841Q700_9BACI|nr:YueI family protein [Salirhabdus euzebyi]MBB6454072.1 uncharacterized protein YueI [Salirhabdus euzebyi]